MHYMMQTGLRAININSACCRFSTESLKKEESLIKARKLAGFVGVLAGSFGALVGVGGGVLIGPVISNACPSLAQRVISGTSLAAVATTGIVSGVVYQRFGSLDLTSSLVIALSAVTTSPLGSLMAHRLPSLQLKRILGWWLIGVSPLIPMKNIYLSNTTQKDKVLKGGDAGSGGGGSEVFRPFCAMDIGLAVTGAVAGFASGLLGIGGGTIVTPALALFTPLSQASVVGTSLGAMILPSLAALTSHARLGNVDWKMAGLLVVGTFVGSLSASLVAVQAPEWVMEGAFSSGMLYLGYKTLSSLKK